MKVFVTVGSMLPFDRLVMAMDGWAAAHPEARVFAQIGEGARIPTHFEHREMLSPEEYRKRFAESDMIVSHVGMGTIITAFEMRKPLVMLPRRPELMEVTSNHQVATARWLEGRPGIRIVHEEVVLPAAIAECLGSGGAFNIDTGTRDVLINTLREFIAA